MRGITLLSGGRGWGAQEPAQAYADQALRLDPEFVPAYTLKALTYIGAAPFSFASRPAGVCPRSHSATPRT